MSSRLLPTRERWTPKGQPQLQWVLPCQIRSDRRGPLRSRKQIDRQSRTRLKEIVPAGDRCSRQRPMSTSQTCTCLSVAQTSASVAEGDRKVRAIGDHDHDPGSTSAIPACARSYLSDANLQAIFSNGSRVHRVDRIEQRLAVWREREWVVA